MNEGQSSREKGESSKRKRHKKYRRTENQRYRNQGSHFSSCTHPHPLEILGILMFVFSPSLVSERKEKRNFMER